MTEQSFLTFNLHGLLLAVGTKVVKEIIWLPELTLIEECPPYIAGVFNMRGRIVPVMDLNIRFGHALQRYSCSDRVIILDVSELATEIPEQQSLLPTRKSQIDLIGIIVNEVLDVIAVPVNLIEPPPFEIQGIRPHPHFVQGEAKTGEDIIMILNTRTIMGPEAELDEAALEKIGTIPH